MEEAIIRLAIAVPAATAVIVTVWLFLQHQKEKEQLQVNTQKEMNQNWADTVKQISQELFIDRQEVKVLIRDNTKALALVADRLRNGEGDKAA